MSKVAIVTDSNSGITQEQAGKLGVSVIPMPFTIEGKEYFEGINLSQEEFFEKLMQEVEIATSQPSPETILNLWESLLQEYDEIVYLPMSSGLSGSCQTAMMLAAEFEGSVQVVDNQRISAPLYHSVQEALAMAEKGLPAVQIKEKLEAEKLESSIYITVDTLKYLKKGGRITPAAAAIGSMLRIKPVLQIQGEKLDAFSKARTMSQAKHTMIEAVRKDIETRFGGMDAHGVYVDVAYTDNKEAALKFKQEIEDALPGYPVRLMIPLSLSVACHVGEGALGIGCTRILQI